MKKVIIPVILILAWGLIEILSISLKLFYLQLIWSILGIILIFLGLKIKWKNIFNYPWLIWSLYIFSILILFLTLIFGPTIRGTKGWLVLGPIRFQPVELSKIVLILVYAIFFSRRHLLVSSWRIILKSFVLFLIPAIFVLLQPDLGSVLILFGIWFSFLVLSGLPAKKIIVSFLIFLILGVIAWNYYLKDYHKARILGIFYPQDNALTINYSVIQSKIAIGSGGLWGKGFRQGTQTQLGFLTEPATDFILAALIEEWGLVVGIFIILIFIFFLFNLIKLGARLSVNFLKFIYLGSAIVFALHFFVNVLSVIGLFPVVGIPLPFLSYGGSNLLTNFFLLSIIVSIKRDI